MSSIMNQPLAGKTKGKLSQDFDLNITSIIDCFTVLITFMLVAASFVSVGILDAGASAAGNAPISSEKNQLLLTINIKEDKSVYLKVTGKINHSLQINSKNGSLDFAALSQNIADFKKNWSDLSAATLIADNSVEYQDVVKTMESVRSFIPAVLLGRF